ncbi:MAG: hypothetical protein ACREA0_27520, partial [bacterium]
GIPSPVSRVQPSTQDLAPSTAASGGRVSRFTSAVSRDFDAIDATEQTRNPSRAEERIWRV